jgi:hypothetical protein
VTQATCHRCGTLPDADDMFCGGCGNPLADAATMPQDPLAPDPASDWLQAGEPSQPEAGPFLGAPLPEAAVTRLPPAGPGSGPAPSGQGWPNGRADPPPAQTASSRALAGWSFGHAAAVSPDDGTPSGVMSNATRYLCAAAYLAPWFANTVLGELIASHRAVAPSRGIDLVPILRHCLMARRMQLIRDALLCALLLAGLIFVSVPLVYIMVAALILSASRGADWERRSVGGGGAVVVALATVAALVLLVGFASLGSFASAVPLSPGEGLSSAPLSVRLALGGGFGVSFAVSVLIYSLLPALWRLIFRRPGRRPAAQSEQSAHSPRGFSLRAAAVTLAFLDGFFTILSPTSALVSPGMARVNIVLGILLLAALGAVLGRFGYLRIRTLATWLSPGGTAPPFARQPEPVENRIAEVAGAQHGNLTLYDLEDPFIGTGITPFNVVRDDERVWSIAIELSRKGAKRGLLDTRRPGSARIDPVELHGVLRRRLLELNDPELALNERVRSLTVDGYVVGEGQPRWDSPLIDSQRLIPYSQASPEAIDALIRHPQAGLRFYQRVSVSDEGPEVRAGQFPVVGAVDQEVIISAFVYVAVEGHMFYLQFVPASLAPIAEEFHVVDRIPKAGSARFGMKVLLDAASTAFRDVLAAPGELFRAWRVMSAEGKRSAQQRDRARDYVFADAGAQLSVREFGAALWPRTYIQRLDASKYTQIIERLVIETVLDYLDSKDVDTAAYRARAEAIYNSGTIIAGNIGGNFNINTGSGSATQRGL